MAGSIHDAVRNDDLAALARILKSSPPDTVNSVLPGKITPLHLAAALNRVPIANYLLLNGADVNAVTENGFTPLHWAAARDSVELLQLLLARGADPNIRADAGITPAHWAAAQNATNALRILISSGGDCQAKTTQGLTPLHWALSKRAREAATMLASHVATRDSESDTARAIARPDEKLPPWREAPPAQSLSAAATPGQPLPIHGNVFNLALGFGETITFVWIEPAKLWVSTTEITNAQYRRFAPDHDSKFNGKYSLNEPEQPAVFVSWHNAKAFCEWLNRNFALRLPPHSECRLPTAAEWALLAGCEKQRVYPWGNDWPPRHGNFADTSARCLPADAYH
ncbi:MAG: ankyrin repeat domain-containing protein [Kiritimatiellia bacterium]